MNLLSINSRRVYATLIATCLYVSLYSIIDWDLPADRISGGPESKNITFFTFLASDKANTVVATWRQEVDDENDDIYAATYNVATKKWGTPVKISTGDGFNETPKAVIVGENQAVITWKNGNDIYVRQYFNNETPNDPIKMADEAADDDYPFYSVIAYKNKHVLIAYRKEDTKEIYIADYNAADNAIEVEGGAYNVSDDAPATEENRVNPCLAVQPGTDVLLIAWMQSNDDSSTKYPVGTQVTHPLVNPPEEKDFTIFKTSEDNDMREPSIPQIVFNPADNNPHLLWASNKLPGEPEVAIVGTKWYPYLAEDHTEPISQEDYNIISTVTDLSGANLLPFCVTTNKANLFTVVYQVNDKNSETPYVYGASYVPGNNSPENDQISIEDATKDLGFPQVVSIGNSSNGTPRNVVVWVEDDKMYGAIYTPGSEPQEKTQLSDDEVGVVPQFNGQTLGLVVAKCVLPVTIWNQIIDDDVETAVFGIEGNGSAPKLSAIQQLHRFPRCGDLVTILSMSPTGNPVSYQIYLKKDLTKPIGTVNANTVPATFSHYCRIPCTSDTYYVYEIDKCGNKSTPAEITVPANQ